LRCNGLVAAIPLITAIKNILILF